MSDGKKRRYRKPKEIEKRPIILAKRDDFGVVKAEPEPQPKIILKTKDSSFVGEANEAAKAHTGSSVGEVPLKTIIVTRSEAAQSPILSCTTNQSNPTTLREQLNDALPNASRGEGATQPAEPVPQMTRPSTVISSTGLINAFARKLLAKSNSDFLVVGVIGTQGVGKSTIMNLLANEQSNYDYYEHVFVEEDGVFPTKLKQHKCSARSRTESTHMFITNDRLILLDSPPVLCNSYKKDMTTNELDDLRNIMSFLAVCHLLIVVQDDYVNMNFLRLLQFAELMKPMHDNKPFLADYFPNLLFVKNRAKRIDYECDGKQRLDRMLCSFFKDTQLRVFVGQTAADQQQQRQRKAKQVAACSSGLVSTATIPEPECTINSFLLPEVTSAARTPFHAPLSDIVEQLRNLVFMTPRNKMYAGATELTEAIWFDLLTKVAQDTQHFFFNTYEEIQRRHFEIGTGSGGSGGGVGNAGGANNQLIHNSKEAHENWRD